MILMYHRVSDKKKNEGSCIGLYAFICQMLSLKKREVVYLDDYDPNNPEQVVISFDDAYRDVWDNVVPLLKHFDYPFEVFVVEQFLAYKNCMDLPLLAKLRECSRGRLQFHGKTHQDLKNVTDKAAIQAEISVPESLKKLDPDGFKWFAYPFCSYNPQVLEAIKQEYSGAVSGKGLGNTDIYSLERVKITAETDWQKIFPFLSVFDKIRAWGWYVWFKSAMFFKKKQADEG